MKAHFFDIDTIIEVDCKVWIVNNKNPKNPIMKISKSEYNLIKSGIYKNQNNSITIYNQIFWFPSEIWNSIKVKCKKLNIDINNIDFSMQEFLNPEIISDLESNINIDILNKIKNTTDHIYIICSKKVKKAYDKIIEKLEEKLYEIGLEIKDYYFIQDNFFKQNKDESKYKKIKILLQHSLGQKTDNNKFSETEIEEYDEIHYYDEDVDSLGMYEITNDVLKILIDNTNGIIKERTNLKLKNNEKLIFFDYVSPNKVDRISSKKLKLEPIKIIKTFEGFKNKF